MAKRYLVVGASGHLGSTVTRRLLDRGHEVRAFVRDPDRLPDGLRVAADVVQADLHDAATLPPAVDGVDVVVATATGALPRAGENGRTVDLEGYAYLVDACAAAGVRRVVFASVPVGPNADSVAILKGKKDTEARLSAAPFEHRVARFPAFSDVWLALVGSSIPVHGERHALNRPFPFLRTYRKVTGTLVERRGLLLAPGGAAVRQAFITVDDAAAVLVAAATDPNEGSWVLECGGPEVLTWRDVADAYSRLLGRRVRVVSQPAPVFRVLQTVMSPSLPASTIMGMSRYMALTPAPFRPAPEVTGYDLARQTTVEEFLRSRLTLVG